MRELLRPVIAILLCRPLVSLFLLILTVTVTHSRAENSVSTSTILKELNRITVGTCINAIAWNSSGTRLVALSDFGRDITLWDSSNWKAINAFHNPGAAYSGNSLAIMPNGNVLTTPSLGTSVDPKYETLSIFSLVEWNPETGTPVRYIPDLGYPPSDTSRKAASTYIVSKDGSMIAIVWAHEVRIYDANTRSLIKTLPIPSASTHSDMPKSLAFSPNGHELAVGTLFGKLHLYTLQNGLLRKSLTAYKDELYSVSALAYSPDGSRIATGQHKNLNLKNPNTVAVSIWNVQDGTLLATLDGSTTVLQGKTEANPVRTIAWSPSGDQLAVGDGASLRVWRIGQGNQTLLLDKSIPHGAYSVSFSPQGTLAAAENNEVVIYR